MKLRNPSCAWLVVALAAILHTSALAVTWNFDADELDKEPAGFYFDTTGRAHDGKWRVVDDEMQHVLAQLDRTHDPDRLALAVVEDSSIEHVKVSVRMKAVAGDLDQAGGVMWRYRDSENYFVARLDISERNVRLYRFRDGNRVQFGVKEKLDVNPGQWYTLRVEHRGDDVKVYLDDDILIIERERHFDRPGRVGLWTKSDSVMHFDDFQAEDLNNAPTTATAATTATKISDGAMRLLVVEDEPDLAAILRQALIEAGFSVDAATDGEAGLVKALQTDYDAIVLDLMLPRLDGASLLTRLRDAKTTPVLVLTARDAQADKVANLNRGADDYLTKPFDLDELVARLRALIRRSSRRPAPVVRPGTWSSTPPAAWFANRASMSTSRARSIRSSSCSCSTRTSSSAGR